MEWLWAVGGKEILLPAIGGAIAAVIGGFTGLWFNKKKTKNQNKELAKPFLSQATEYIAMYVSNGLSAVRKIEVLTTEDKIFWEAFDKFKHQVADDKKLRNFFDRLWTIRWNLWGDIRIFISMDGKVNYDNPSYLEYQALIFDNQDGKNEYIKKINILKEEINKFY